MVPYWAGGLAVRVVILAFGCLIILGGAWLASGNLGQIQKGSVEDQVPKAEAATKLNVVEADPSKLPADIVKELNDAIKLVTLAEAIHIAETSAKGQAVKAERLGDGAAARFNIDVVGKDGSRSHINVDATGNVIEKRDRNPLIGQSSASGGKSTKPKGKPSPVKPPASEEPKDQPAQQKPGR